MLKTDKPQSSSLIFFLFLFSLLAPNYTPSMKKMPLTPKVKNPEMLWEKEKQKRSNISYIS